MMKRMRQAFWMAMREPVKRYAPDQRVTIYVDVDAADALQKIADLSARVQRLCTDVLAVSDIPIVPEPLTSRMILEGALSASAVAVPVGQGTPHPVAQLLAEINAGCERCYLLRRLLLEFGWTYTGPVGEWLCRELTELRRHRRDARFRSVQTSARKD